MSAAVWAEPAAQVRPAPRAHAGHRYEIDLMRVVTFASVIAVHGTSATTSTGSETGNGVLVFLHFTRESFFFLTGFVLVYAYQSRPLRPVPFLRRRFTLVGVPYLVWTAIYIVIGVASGTISGRGLVRTIGIDLLTGNAKYHLYFLLVSLQAYLLFPVFRRLMSRYRHGTLLALAVLVEALVTVVLQYGPRPSGPVGHALSGHASVLIVSYPLYLVGGALAAAHRAALGRFVDRHPTAIAGIVVSAAALAALWYAADLRTGQQPLHAAAVLEPLEMIWSSAAILGLYAVCLRWSRSGQPRRAQRAVMWASRASFGIYLCHPAILQLVVGIGGLGPGTAAMPQPARSLLAIVVTMALAAGFVAVVQRTALAFPLSGRPRQRA